MTRVTACAAAVITALAAAPVARADGDADYLERLSVYGIYGDANAIAWGHRICTDVSSGATPLAEAHALRQNSPQLTEQQTDGEVDAALQSYCFAVTASGVNFIPT